MEISFGSEQTGDVDAIAHLTEAAFRDAPHSSHTEHFIVNALRRGGQLTISLVARRGEEIVGHVAISPITFSSGDAGWFGLGPVSVRPDCQRQGIGSKLVQTALADLRRAGGRGCVVLGDPAFYGRFGFRTCPGLEYPGVPQEYFQAMSFEGKVPVGVVRYHDAFEATG